MAWVYLVRCRDGSLYCGATVDLTRRLATHAQGRGAKYIRAKGFVGLAAAWEVDTWQEALRREGQLKKFTKRQKEVLVTEQLGSTC